MNSINSKVAIMEQKITDLQDRNSCEHTSLFKTLRIISEKQDNLEKSLQKGFEDIRVGAEVRKAEYVNLFATKDELEKTNARVNLVSNIYFGVATIVAFVWAVLSLFREDVRNFLHK